MAALGSALEAMECATEFSGARTANGSRQLEASVRVILYCGFVARHTELCACTESLDELIGLGAGAAEHGQLHVEQVITGLRTESEVVNIVLGRGKFG